MIIKPYSLQIMVVLVKPLERLEEKPEVILAMFPPPIFHSNGV
jgi:hypothetical protein